MRWVFMALVVAGVIPALGQAGTIGPQANGGRGLTSSPVLPPAKQSEPSPTQWQMQPGIPFAGRSLPAPVAPRDLQIDPQIAIHPEPWRLGEQPLGTLMARNLYPGLMYQPIQLPHVKAEPIPTVWPELKMEPIPTQCAKCTWVLVQGIPEPKK